MKALKVLIVDDEAPLGELISRFLPSVLPASFIIETELDSGLLTARREKPDAVLLDLKIGHIQPEETIATIPEFDSIAPTLVITGTVEMDKYLVPCHKAGAMAFLPKDQWIASGRAGYLGHAITTAILNWRRFKNGV